MQYNNYAKLKNKAKQNKINAKIKKQNLIIS